MKLKRDFGLWEMCFLSVVTPSMCFNLNSRSGDTCEPIDIPLCKHMPYNMTRMPNLLHHSSQENANLAIEQFHQLIEQNCSDVLQFFLCAMYAPICTVNFQHEPIPPCRSVCERARAGCERIVNFHNVSWPDYLDCSRLPRYDRGVCVSPEAIVTSTKKITSNDTGNKPFYPKLNPEPKNQRPPTDVGSKVCNCNPKVSKPKRKRFKKGKFHFAIQGRILQQGIINNANTVTRVEVLKVLKESKVQVKVNATVDLWTNSTCVCPRLIRNRTYLLIGYEDAVTQRLLFLDNCLAAKWKKKWVKRLKNWDKKKGKKCRNPKSKRCRKGRKRNKKSRKGKGKNS
ncbi:secreted frizzled-related protein 3-like [Crassostrea angulata]|uniref:Secreted frizzled-related protein 3 n=1 Tax=Magallana gigas TaxID=29159 RepID=A0A8W8N9V2_MAGGI|nr:secreted frizzled-related protein 3 [Crassostrea gigas]XP_052688607.1 secreted frizzled-related protein 3-like [Crassostrea angulata]|eukprot:XP_011435544.1 PREDICTED: secreted frizzled-related protein 3 [Crassostrea gigas]